VIQLILFLLVGAMLFFSLYLLVRRSSHAEGSAEELLEARQALNALQLGLLPHEIVRRIFATEDLDYVTSETPECIRELFLEERKGIALSWACQVRRQLLSLRQFHLGSARFYAQLNVRTEIRLAAEFAGLLLACRALQMMLFLRGPYAAPRVVEVTAAAAVKVCGISEKSLAFLKPAYLPAGSDSSSGDQATA
jgi:ABC-type Fe3+-siderophore transport system permease subunit